MFITNCRVMGCAPTNATIDHICSSIRNHIAPAFGRRPGDVSHFSCRNHWQVGRINIAAVMSLAMAPARPGNAVLANAMELDNNTVITWDPVPGEGVSYQVLCRETDRSEWAAALPDGSSGIVPAGGGTSFSCPFSKDNYYFAVRAVSPGGHPGLPSLAK